MRKVLTLFIILFGLNPFLWAQTKLVFLDKLTGTPLDGVAIYTGCGIAKCLDKHNIQFSNSKGEANFSITHVFELQAHLIGYAFYKGKVEPNETVTIKLEPNKNDLSELVVTGQYEATQTEKTLQKVTIIDQKRIKAQAAVNLRDLLTNELNIRISQDNLLGSSLSLQGIAGQNIKLLINGVPIIGRMNGNIDLGQINLNSIERVEIIEGPMSVAYGTDALGGVINLITKKPEQNSAAVNSYYESVGQFNNSIAASIQKNKNAIQVNIARNAFNGYTSSSYYNNNIKPYIIAETYSETYNRKQQWLPKTQWNADALLMHKIKGGDITFQSTYFNELLINKGLPTINQYNAYAFDDYFKTQRFNNYLFLNKKLKNKANLNLQGAYSLFERNKNTYRKDLVTLTENQIPDKDDQASVTFSAINARGTYSTQQHAKLNYQLGYDVNSEWSSGDRVTSGSQITDAAAFLSLDFKPNHRITIRPALRAAYNSRFSAPVIPSINFKADISSKSTIRFSYSNGFRAPSLKELDLYFFDFNHAIQGNNQLNAEISNNFNLYYTWKNVTPHWIVKIEPGAFYNKINQMISLVMINANTTPPLYSYRNIDNFETFGAIVNTELKHKLFSINAGANYTARYNLLSNIFTGTDKFLYSPEFRLNTQIPFEYKTIQLTTALFYKYTGNLPGYAVNDNNELVQTNIEDYHTCDASITATKGWFSVQTGVKNIFNVTNLNNTNNNNGVHGGGGILPAFWGRTYFVSFQIQLTTKN